MVESNVAPVGGKKDRDGNWTVGGVFVGQQISDSLFSEKAASCRFVIRSNSADRSFPKRVGEVFGRPGDYQACLMRGDHVGNAGSVLKAASLLESRELGGRASSGR